MSGQVTGLRTVGVPLSEESPPKHNRGPSPEAEFGVIWEVFTTQPGLGVMLTSPDGVIEYVNSALAEEYLERTPEEIIGHPITEFTYDVVGKEVMDAITRVVGTGTQVIRRVLLQGQEIQFAYRWLPEKGFGRGRVLITAQKGFKDPELSPDVEVVEAGFVDLGPLNVLSDRELEVLTLLGQGLRFKEIAGALKRSPKTIDSHLRSIRSKVKTTDRAVLMGMAREAGLNLKMIRQRRMKAIIPKKKSERPENPDERRSASNR